MNVLSWRLKLLVVWKWSFVPSCAFQIWISSINLPINFLHCKYILWTKLKSKRNTEWGFLLEIIIFIFHFIFHLSFTYPSLFLELHAKWHEKQKSGSSEAKWGQRGARANTKWRRHSKLNEKPSHLRNFHVHAVLQSWFKQKTVKWSITRNELISCCVLITAQVSIIFLHRGSNSCSCHILIHC